MAVIMVADVKEKIIGACMFLKGYHFFLIFDDMQFVQIIE